MATTTGYLVLVAIPIVGAAVGLLMWKNTRAMKVCLLVTALISGVSIGVIAATSETSMSAGRELVLLLLLPLAAFVTLLGQPTHRSLGSPWVLTLVLLGCGLGVLAFEAPLSRIFFLLVLMVVGLMLVQHARQARANATLSVGTIVFGILSVIMAGLTSPPVSSIALAMACAVMLPLVPFHKSYVGAVTALPGNVPAFLAVLLPVIGFDGLLTVLPDLPDAVAQGFAIVALAGVLYGSLKALTQSRATSIVAYGGLAFFSISWWYLTTTRSAVPYTVIYVSGVALAASGLLVALSLLRIRYGETTLRAVGGLGQPMPRFAVALSLLAVAALGLPPFGVFAGFLGMVLAPSFRDIALSGGTIVILIGWLAASWYLFDLTQTLLFGRQQPERGHKDLRPHELGALAIILVLLVALGVLPASFFGSGATSGKQTVKHENLRHAAGPGEDSMEFPAWMR